MAGSRPHSTDGCRDVIDLLTEYMEDALPLTTARALARHLRGCSACSEYLATLRRTRTAVGRLRCDAMPAEAHARLRRFLDARLPRSRP